MLSVQINLHTILKNVATIKRHLHSGMRFCAVIKANAYGFGLIQMGQLLSPVVDCFAVATVTEGVILRRSGIKQDILVFGICDDVVTALKHNLIITIENITQAHKLLKEQLHPRIQV